jgi:hypothetical protein
MYGRGSINSMSDQTAPRAIPICPPHQNCAACKTLVPGLPIFAADLVAFNGRVSLCIADVAPSTMDLSLPPAYLAAAAALRYGEVRTRAGVVTPEFTSQQTVKVL